MRESILDGLLLYVLDAARGHAPSVVNAILSLDECLATRLASVALHCSFQDDVVSTYRDVTVAKLLGAVPVQFVDDAALDAGVSLDGVARLDNVLASIEADSGNLPPRELQDVSHCRGALLLAASISSAKILSESERRPRPYEQ